MRCRTEISGEGRCIPCGEYLRYEEKQRQYEQKQRVEEAIYLQEEALEQQKHMQEELLEKQQKLQQEIESAKREHAQVNEVRSNIVNLSVLGKYEQLYNYLNSHYFKEVEFQDSVQLEIQSNEIIKNYYLNNFAKKLTKKLNTDGWFDDLVNFLGRSKFSIKDVSEQIADNSDLSFKFSQVTSDYYKQLKIEEKKKIAETARLVEAANKQQKQLKDQQERERLEKRNAGCIQFFFWFIVAVLAVAFAFNPLVKNLNQILSSFTEGNSFSNESKNQSQNSILSSYICVLSASDLYNSRGAYLPNVEGVDMSDILLQDRFNYHAGRNIDAGDRFDELHNRVNSDNYRSIYESRIVYLEGISVDQALSGISLRVEITNDQINLTSGGN
jgi:hypothetical protein